jgi:hypothetical protein
MGPASDSLARSPTELVSFARDRAEVALSPAPVLAPETSRGASGLRSEAALVAPEASAETLEVEFALAPKGMSRAASSPASVGVKTAIGATGRTARVGASPRAGRAAT